MKTKSPHGIFRAVGVALVGALVAVGGAGAAQAATEAPVNLIDSTREGSITIHKFENPDEATGLAHDGMAVSPDDLADLTAMPGVTFTVHQIGGYDLTTNEAWTRLAALTPQAAKNGPFGVQRTVETGANGEAVATGLPVGVYLVTETVYPAGATPAAPFLITVPLTNPANDAEWVYHVHAYPKNEITTATKTVDDEPTDLFEDVVWTILADIPDVDVIDGYKIVDPLDRRLTYVSTEVSLSDGTTLAAGTDYLMPVFDAATNTVTVEFTQQGRETLAANSELQVQVDITTNAN